MGDPAVQDHFRKLADDPRQNTVMYVKAVNAAIRDVPDDMTVCTHTCRGNFKSTFLASGRYDFVADNVFSGLESMVSFWNTRPNAPAASSRSGSCRKARRSSWDWSAPSFPNSRRRRRSSGGSIKQRSTLLSKICASAPNAGSPAPTTAIS